MSRYRVYLALAIATLFLTTVAIAQDLTEQSAEKTTELPTHEDSETKEYYPISWTKVNYKPVIDNERLFRKYKQCLLVDKTTGCPRDVLQLKKIIPEVLETMCAKCLPVHIERFKEAVEYICKKRRADYDEVRKSKDPNGSLQTKFEDKFGKVNC
ncbi:putative odorant-binding protein A10 [Phymastichus coffea]|uniref:putative odorant-binding protein A10 n=1 Tax=Phymastichus coffea TaxID=108790 RepID=UPI00273C245D|nr:putative odorant-binding protein A10 [Phymastichus coffea]